MPKGEASIIIHAPVEKVFAYLEDPMSNPEWLPGMIAVKDIVTTEDRIGSSFKWLYKMAGIQFEGKSTTLEFEPGQRLVVKSEGGIVSTWSWTFAPHDDGTKLDVVIDYKVPVPVLGKLAEALVHKQNQREVDLAMLNIKTRMEA
jgi:uncharacterized protein YndB with AHSA1/START domain